MSRSKLMAHTRAQGEIRSTEGPPVVNPHATGADIGAQQIYICLPGPDQTQIVRSFGTYTAEGTPLPIGWSSTASRPSPWNPPASTGSPCSRSWKGAASVAAAPPRPTDRASLSAHPAHAKGAHPHERPPRPGSLRPHRRHRLAHHPRHCGGRAQPPPTCCLTPSPAQEE